MSTIYTAFDDLSTTPGTWLKSLLGGDPAGLQQAVAYVTSRYHGGLCAAFKTTSWYRANTNNPDWDPRTVVDCFLRDRLLRPGYLAARLESGEPLRWQLVYSLVKHYVFERNRELKSTRRHGRRDSVGDGPLVHTEDLPQAHRAFVIWWMRLAIATTARQQLRRPAAEQPQGAEVARVLVRHVYGSQTREQTPRRLGISIGAVAHRARLARLALKNTLAEFLEIDGIAQASNTDQSFDQQVNHEIQELIDRLLKRDDPGLPEGTDPPG